LLVLLQETITFSRMVLIQAAGVSISFPDKCVVKYAVLLAYSRLGCSHCATFTW